MMSRLFHFLQSFAVSGILGLVVAVGVLGFPATSMAAITDLVAPSTADEDSPGDSEAKLRASLETQIEETKKEQLRLQNEVDQLTRSIKNAPSSIAVMRKDIEVVGQLLGRDKLEKLTLQQVTERLAQLEAQQHAIDLALNDVYQQIAKQQNIPAQAREKIASLQAEIDDTEKRIQSLQGQGSVEGIRALKLQLAESERDRLIALRKLSESQLDGYQKMLELYTASRDLLTAQLTAMNEVYTGLQARFDLLSKSEAARQQAAFAEIEQALAGMPQPVIDAAITNKKQNDQLILLQQSQRDIVARDKEYNDVIQEIKQRYQVAAQQLDIGGHNRFYLEHVRYVTRILRPLLNESGDMTSLQGALIDARSKQFTYDDQLRELRSHIERQRKIERALEKMTPEERVRPTVTVELQKLYTQRETLLEELSKTNGNYVVALTNFELSLKRLQNEERKFMSMLNQKLVWLHSSPAMSWDVGLTAAKGAYAFFVDTPWMELPQSLNEYRKAQPIPTTLAIFVLLSLLYWRRRLLQMLDTMSVHIGKVGHDKFRYTVEAVIVTLVVALPIPLVIAVVGYAFIAQAPYQSFPFTVGELLLRMSPLALLIAMLPIMIRKHGLATLHFGWPEQVLTVLRKQLPWFVVQLPVFAFGIYIINNAGDQRSVFMFGRVFMAAANVILAFNCWTLLRPGTGLIAPRNEYSFFDEHWRERYLWMPLFIGVPVFCAILAVVGYDFTVVFFASMFYVTLCAGVLIYLTHQVFTRWFAVQERQIALDRALAKRAAERAAKEKEGMDAAAEGLVDVDVLDEINLESISERNRTLLNVMAYSVFVAVLWQLWSDVAPALDVLDKYVLWSMKGIGDTGQVEQVPITLWRFLCATFVLVLTVIAGRNLPGLVEVVLLQRFQLEKSIRFAITTVARYCIFVVGIMLGSELLGIAWQKIGWLVAALGVGLGFGLQEIFANFISGIIVLIERPIRIGDAVTINGQTGIVSQIRMRATTVIDSDQKELIIPNKMIMTNQLVNWTLTDSVTRLVIPISVTHSADVELVIRTLLEVAQQHPNVMKTPAPGAFFLSFGDKKNFELRCFVPELAKRTVTLHDINMAIERRFRAQGIEISPNFTDVRLSRMPEAALDSAHLPINDG